MSVCTIIERLYICSAYATKIYNLYRRIHWRVRSMLKTILYKFVKYADSCTHFGYTRCEQICGARWDKLDFARMYDSWCHNFTVRLRRAYMVWCCCWQQNSDELMNRYSVYMMDIWNKQVFITTFVVHLKEKKF